MKNVFVYPRDIDISDKMEYTESRNKSTYVLKKGKCKITHKFLKLLITSIAIILDALYKLFSLSICYLVHLLCNAQKIYISFRVSAQ